jgi:hypothetical protein
MKTKILPLGILIIIAVVFLMLRLVIRFIKKITKVTFCYDLLYY